MAVADREQQPGVARRVPAAEFKASCLKLMDEVAAHGAPIVVTKRNRPVAELAPYREKPRSLFGIDRDRFEIVGDIVSPMPMEWYTDPEDSDLDRR